MMMMKKTVPFSPSKPTRRSHVVCVCDLRKKYEAKITSKVKENVNKILVMGTVDFKMMYEILKEVDEMHKDKLEAIMKGAKGEGERRSSPEVSIDGGDDGENIFLEKN